ncbi:hypothetical protein LZ32DRAFT_93822 [Colletotrichum eremochloae]|nr:hypothetical protein LZ32DRAFT_93822 [Colletotrichum eremochloae]
MLGRPDGQLFVVNIQMGGDERVNRHYMQQLSMCAMPLVPGLIALPTDSHHIWRSHYEIRSDPVERRALPISLRNCLRRRVMIRPTAASARLSQAPPQYTAGRNQKLHIHPQLMCYITSGKGRHHTRITSRSIVHGPCLPESPSWVGFGCCIRRSGKKKKPLTSSRPPLHIVSLSCLYFRQRTKTPESARPSLACSN